MKACLRDNESEVFAIKKIKSIFEHTAFAHRAMREIRLLRCIGDHENIVKIHEISLPEDAKAFKDISVISDYMNSDLHSIIRLNIAQNTLKKSHI